LPLVPDVDVQVDHSYAKRNVLGGDGLSEIMGKAIGNGCLALLMMTLAEMMP
jgi:hypothetical protein